MRLKVKGDTFFLPNPDGGVFFRNNIGSFRMEGSSINQWIEKLIPVFNGEHSMENLTDGLPAPYRERVYEIAEVLYANGFVRDVSQDRPHQLPVGVLQKYASQIEFLDSFGGSGAHRFQLYRQAKVLAIGSGSFFISLIKSLLESGLPKFHMLITDSASTNRQRLLELVENARGTDLEVEAKELFLPKEGGLEWRSVVEPFDLILYVSQQSGVSELRALHAVCREERKVLLPAFFAQQAGLAGPLIHPDSNGCLESALRRIHDSALNKDAQLHTISSTAEAMLANVIVFETFKTITEVAASELRNKLFLLNLETLEGDWHTFLPHPLVNGNPAFEWLEDFEMMVKQVNRKKESNGIFPYFSRLTSMETGVFHIWDEGELNQLPLSQCLVQVADPLSEGPAALLPEIVCNGLDHMEARKTAGLAGIEAYVSRMARLLVTAPNVNGKPRNSVELQSFEFMGVGAGETVAEGVSRGMQKCLTEELRKRLETRASSVNRVQLIAVEDKRCRYYINSLTTMQGEPVIGLGEEVSGFPVVWVGTNGRWYGGVDLNLTMALRKALQHALLIAQNNEAYLVTQGLEMPLLIEGDEAQLSVSIPAYEESGDEQALLLALPILKKNGKRLLVFDLASESFLKEELAGAFGVLLREEESH